MREEELRRLASAWAAEDPDPATRLEVTTLLQRDDVEGLRERFGSRLEFGTAGIRGILGAGPNRMNRMVVMRTTAGLAAYLKAKVPDAARRGVVVGYDARHLSLQASQDVASILEGHGIPALVFPDFAPTPLTAFAVRHLGAAAGVMITASHNPAHDNGYKVYFKDGDPIIDPVAPAILEEVNAIQSDAFTPVPEDLRGKVTILGAELDEEYRHRLKTIMLRPELLAEAKDLKIVYTPIHGAGSVHVPAMLKELGFNFLTVKEQDVPDGRFPTVDSPNPENAPALQMAIDLAEREQADIVIGTDPDCDRMGVAVRDGQGRMRLITGNQIGSLMAWYRLKTMFEKGWLTEENKGNAVVVKTFVTTRLQDTVAEAFGVPVVNTLTGFKYIGGKLCKYERALPEDIQARYRSMTEEETRAARLAHGKFFVFGGEESYGYLGADWIRDKDGNGAVVMFAELAAYAASRNLTVPDLLDEIYLEYGYFHEHSESVFFEGASGAATMKKLMDSYTASPFKTLAGVEVANIQHFGLDDIRDAEGDLLPKENMLFCHMANGYRFVIRPSGTEPKIKAYLFGEHRPAPGGRLDAAQLPAIKEQTRESLKTLWAAIKADMDARVAA